MKRWTFRILLCLLLGVVTTLGVGWGLAWYWTPARWSKPDGGYSHAAGPSWWVLQNQMTGSLILERSPDFDEQPEVRAMMPVPSWSACRTPPKSDTPPGVEFAFGWPFLALVGENVGPEGELRGFIPLDDYGYYGLPLLPTKVGSAADTAFYGLIWFALLFGVTATRRGIRRRRGRCVKCGYDLRSGFAGEERGCPECGWGREGS